MRKTKRILAIILALTAMMSLSVCAFADGSTIDTNRTGTLDIYKYDAASAEKDGVWTEGDYVSIGVRDEDGVETILGGELNVDGTAYGYAIKGVEFTYLRVADIITYTEALGNEGNVEVLYGITWNEAGAELVSILGRMADDRVLGADKEQDGVFTYYFTADTLIAALETSLANDPDGTKTALENYVSANGGTAMPETDEYGHSSATELPLGLYLVVETMVPENVTSTTAPFFVSLPMTDMQNGTGWLYEVTLYPKNLTGIPTLEKLVKEHGSENFSHTATASIGDKLYYQITSTLPTISSEATYLTEYSFKDTAEPGINYTIGNVRLEIFSDAACTTKVADWDEASGKFDTTFENRSVNIAISDSGLAEINSSYSDHTIRISYSATLDSDATFGDHGNTNCVELTWRRTNSQYYDTLTDECHVHTYGIELTKKFSDGKGDFSQIEMLLQNKSDEYYILAEYNEEDKAYYVTGATVEKDSATRLTPEADGMLRIHGIEADSYVLSEIKTAKGYTLPRKGVEISILASEKDGKLTAKSTINGKDTGMERDGESGYAFVSFGLVNSKGFDLPQTGSFGNWMYPVIGMALIGVAGSVLYFANSRRDDEDEEME